MKKGAAKYIAGGSIVLGGIIMITAACLIGGWGVLQRMSNASLTPKGFFTGTNIEDSISDTSFDNIKLDIGFGEVTVKTANVTEVIIEAENVIQNYFKYEVRENTLSISYEGIFTFFSFNSGAKISITIPESVVLNNVYINNGAGKMTVSDISADKIELETGAGELVLSNICSSGNAGITTGAGAVTLTNLSCGKLYIESGVGAVNAEDVTCSGLELDSGVGSFTFSGTVNGNADIDTGVGEVIMYLNGSSADYSFKVDSGVGKVKVNGNTPVQSSSAKYTFKVDNGVGAVTIDFSENS